MAQTLIKKRLTRLGFAIRALAPHLFPASESCRCRHGPSAKKRASKGTSRRKRMQMAEKRTTKGSGNTKSRRRGNAAALVVTRRERSPLGPKVLGWQPQPEPRSPSPNLLGWSPTPATRDVPQPQPKATHQRAPLSGTKAYNYSPKNLEKHASQLTSVLGFTVGPTMAVAMAVSQTRMWRG
ncbi:hypothetical protein PQX77_011680 [Marasmius sp. AFHP31]|nr:hypothetical protein PQX77_011680 [Marasmius sp. AFHP31]